MYLTQGCHHFFSFLNLRSKIKENNTPPCGKPRYPSHSLNILMNPRTYVYIYKLGNTNFLRYKNQIIHTSICVIPHNPSSLTFFTIAVSLYIYSIICHILLFDNTMYFEIKKKYYASWLFTIPGLNFETRDSIIYCYNLRKMLQSCRCKF